MSTITATTPALELRSHADWHPWIRYIRGIANNAMIWDYINPDKTKANVKTVTYPFLDINLDAPPDKDVLAAYNILLGQYSRISANLSVLSAIVDKSVQADFWQQIMWFDDLHDRMIHLKVHFAPSDAEWSAVLQEKIFQARAPSPSQDLSSWADYWITLGIEISVTNIPGINTVTLSDQFLYAARCLDHVFAAITMNIPQEDPTARTYILESVVNT